jgi:hypothetical protein
MRASGIKLWGAVALAVIALILQVAGVATDSWAEINASGFTGSRPADGAAVTVGLWRAQFTFACNQPSTVKALDDSCSASMSYITCGPQAFAVVKLKSCDAFNAARALAVIGVFFNLFSTYFLAMFAVGKHKKRAALVASLVSGAFSDGRAWRPSCEARCAHVCALGDINAAMPREALLNGSHFAMLRTVVCGFVAVIIFASRGDVDTNKYSLAIFTLGFCLHSLAPALVVRERESAGDMGRGKEEDVVVAI